MRALRLSAAVALVTISLIVSACNDKTPARAPKPGATADVLDQMFKSLTGYHRDYAKGASIARLRRELRASPDIHVLHETNHVSFTMAPRDTMVALIKAFLAKPPAASGR